MTTQETKASSLANAIVRRVRQYGECRDAEAAKDVDTLIRAARPVAATSTPSARVGCANNTQPVAMSERVQIVFRSFDQELPELVAHSSSYGGTWDSDWCVVIDQAGTVSMDRFTASENLKLAIESGNRKHARWTPKGSNSNYVAWAYKSEVKTAIDCSAKAAPAHPASEPAEAPSVRDAFETWAIGKGFDVSKDAYGQYHSQDLHRYWQGWEACALQGKPEAPISSLPGWERGIATVTMDGHQLREALDFINPSGDDEPDERDDDLTFGIVQHQDDDGKASTGLCCWNDDSDGVLPLDGKPEAPKGEQA